MTFLLALPDEEGQFAPLVAQLQELVAGPPGPAADVLSGRWVRGHDLEHLPALHVVDLLSGPQHGRRAELIATVQDAVWFERYCHLSKTSLFLRWSGRG